MKKLLLAAGVILVAGAFIVPGKKNIAAPQVYAIVIGVSGYRDDKIPDLKFCDKDARAFADFLRSPKSGAVPAQNIALLVNEKATRAAIIQEAMKIIRRCSKEDLVIFYFSGHGMNGELENFGYLLPWDADDNNIEGSGISMGEINRMINGSAAKMKVSYIDACHAGLFGTDGRKGAAVDNNEIVKSYMEGLKNAGEGNVAFMASAGRQQSAENEKLGHGVFTYYLLKGLNGEADTEQKAAKGYNNGIVTITELQTYLFSKIQSATNYEQRPVVSNTNYDEDFPLSVVKSSANLSQEIAARSKTERKPVIKEEAGTKDNKLPANEPLSRAAMYAREGCYGQVAFINQLDQPLFLYKHTGFGNVPVSVLIGPSNTEKTPRVRIKSSPRQFNDCVGELKDVVFYFRTTNEDHVQYGKVSVTVESGVLKYVALNKNNFYLSDRPN